MDVAVPTAPNNTVSGLAAAINAAVPNVTATVTSGLLTLSVTNFDSAPAGNKLQVAPGSIGAAFDSLGFNTFEWTQTIQSPYPVKFAGFGSSISVDDTATTLVVGAPRGTMYLITIFDDYVELFDAGATSFFTTIDQSGAVYTYDLLHSANGELGDVVALKPKDVNSVPIYSRDAEIFVGTLKDLQYWLRGVKWARDYDNIMKLTDDKKRARKEQDERNRQLAKTLKEYSPGEDGIAL